MTSYHVDFWKEIGTTQLICDLIPVAVHYVGFLYISFDCCDYRT